MVTQTTLARGKDRFSALVPPTESVSAYGRRKFVFGALVTFSVLYYFRPEDFIPGLSYIPMAKIAGVIGFLALIFGVMTGGKLRVPWAIKLLILLLVQMMLTIPFALWRGGAFDTVFNKFSKGVVAALLIGMVVVSVKELRKLLWIQVSAVALVTFFSILLNHRRDGRLEGIQKGILENPNDLATNIAISFPLCVAFMLQARGFKKAVWVVALAFMAVGVVLTYSRSGLLALIISIIVCVWEYGIKGKRLYMIAVAGLALVVGLGVVISNEHYRARVESIVLGNIEGSSDKGSLEARKALLKKSIEIALHHPFFGVGPGGFVLVDQGWVVAHNTYTEIAAEAGIPALVLFLLAIGAAFKNISTVRKSRKYQEDPELKLFTQALWAGLVAYVMGACFASTEYNLYPYFLVAYTCAVVQIIMQPRPRSGTNNSAESVNKTPYEPNPTPQPLWSR